MVAKKKAATKKKPAKPVTPPPETDAVSPAVPGASRAGIAKAEQPPAPREKPVSEDKAPEPINSIRAKVVDVLNVNEAGKKFTVLVCRAIHLGNAGLLKVVGVAIRGDEIRIDVTKKG